MKTLSKKLISLMLVALMLVAAMPVMAFADEVDTGEVNTYDADLSSVIVKIYDADGNEIASTTYGKTFSTGYEEFDEAKKLSTTKSIYNAISFSGKSNYTWDGSAGTYDGVFSITVNLSASHTHKWVLDDSMDATEDGHYIKCSVAGCTEAGILVSHTAKELKGTWTVVKGSGTEDGHTVACSVCGYEKEESHSSSEVSNTVAAKKATCTEPGYTKQTTYACGYVVGGEEDPNAPALGHNFVNGKCSRCGLAEDSDYYDVYIVYKGTNIASDGTVSLSPSVVESYNKTLSLANAKAILSKTISSSNLYSTYAGSMTASIFNRMEIDAGTVFIYVSKDLTDTANAGSEKVTVTVVDGDLSEDRELTVGKSYFNYDLTLGNDNNKTLASLRVSYEVNGKTYTRTIKKGDSDAKVQAYDTKVELLWDAKKVTINFYRNAADGAEKVSTMTIRAGETIEGLPKLDGEYVSWYLESGELLQEGRVYDFSSTTVRAYPYAGGEVYLQIYKNGDTKTPVSNDPVNVTAKVQKNGIISASDLTSIIENKVGKKNLKITGLFDFDGWEEYKSSKSTKYASSTIDVGTADERTGVQFLYVMVNGGTSSSSTADSSNPKTGDSAMPGTAAAVMAAAVLGLGTTAVVLKKKELF